MPIEITSLMSVAVFAAATRITIIVIAAIALNEMIQRVIVRVIRKKVSFHKINKERVDTLTGVFAGTSKFVVSLFALLLILPEFGVNIAALLAGIGVLGLAVSLAAQGIVTDFLSGIFVIIEDQYMIGDKIGVNGVEGTVREMSLRRTVIEDDRGVFHSIPNGQIKSIAKIQSSGDRK